MRLAYLHSLASPHSPKYWKFSREITKSTCAFVHCTFWVALKNDPNRKKSMDCVFSHGQEFDSFVLWPLLKGPAALTKMPLVEFAPLRIPLHRRLETAAIALYYYSFYFGALIGTLIMLGLFFIFFSARERARWTKSCNLIGSGSRRNFPILTAVNGTSITKNL